MRHRIVVAACCVAAAGVLVIGRARAGNCSDAVNPCINDDALWPHAGPSQFVALGAADTVARGQIGFALVTSYLSRPVVLHLASPGLAAGGTDHNVVDDLVDGTFLWSYGVTNRLELDIALPLAFGQGGTGLAPVTAGPGLNDTAVRDTRFGVAYAILPRARVSPDAGPDSTLAGLAPRSVLGIVGRFEVSAPTGDADQFAGERAGVLLPSVVGDFRFGRFFGEAEAGARLRPIHRWLDTAVGSQLVAALGVGYGFLPRERLSGNLEAWVLPTFGGPGIAMTPAEWQLSVRSAPLPGGDLSVQLGGGGGIPFGGDLPVTTPRFRFTLSVRWAPLARDSDGDGVPDAVDGCPTTPAPGSADGCPHDDSHST
jgi:OOP family OmpA-OmpF porin